MSDFSGGQARYLIQMTFESDDKSSGLAKANAWLTLQGDAVDLDTVVGDAFSVSVFYSAKVAPAKPETLVQAPEHRADTGSLQATGPGTYTFNTVGAKAA